MSEIIDILDRELHLARRRVHVAQVARTVVLRELDKAPSDTFAAIDRRVVLNVHACRWDDIIQRFTSELRGVIRVHDRWLIELTKVRAAREQVAA